MSLTFSQLVDTVAASVGRPDKINDIALFVNQTIREAHADNKGRTLLYARNLNEDQLVATVDTGFSWDTVDFFQHLRAVRYDDVGDGCGKSVWPVLRQPGRVQGRVDHFYYRAGPSYFFVGYGATSSKISIAYYVYPRLLHYYSSVNRPATYDIRTSTWTYFDLTAANPPDLDYTIIENQPIAEALVSNWLIFNWYTVMIEGGKAKVFKTVGDEVRSRTHFAQFQQFKQQLVTNEGAEFADN